MYFARREFGKVARVYEVAGDFPLFRPVFGTFLPKLGLEKLLARSTLCGPGCWAKGRTHREALNTLYMHETAAHEELFPFQAQRARDEA